MDDNSRTSELLAIRVASGETIRSAAKSLEVSEGRAYHLARTAAFKKRVGELRTEAVTGAVGKLSEATQKAAQVLVDLLDQTNDPAVRLNAAKAVLNHLLPMAEHAEMRARIDALESRAEPLKVRA